jgi:hypothetical protein
MAWFWWVAVVVGPLLLIGLIVWGTLRTQSSSRGVNRAERGAKELREELEREDENQAQPGRMP